MHYILVLMYVFDFSPNVIHYVLILMYVFYFSPNLTWRDVQHLIVLTSAKNDFSDTYSSWAKNGATKECK